MKGLMAVLFAMFTVVALVRGQVGFTRNAIIRSREPGRYWLRVVLNGIAALVFAWAWVLGS